MSASNPIIYLPWHDVGGFFRERFGGKIAKILIDTGVACPHWIWTGGCTFCNETSILPRYPGKLPSVEDQIRQGIQILERRRTYRGFIAYFQRGTTTAAPAEILRSWLMEAGRAPRVVGLAVATRPDQLDSLSLEVIGEAALTIPVFIDLGLQSCHERTLRRINRGHTLGCFDDATRCLAALPGVLPIAHMNLLLPGETAEDMRASFRHLAGLPLHGVKIHHLQIVQGTRMLTEYLDGEIRFPTQEAYVPLLADVIEELPWRFVIHRLRGDQPTGQLVAPEWTWRKSQLIEALCAEFTRRGTRQGSACPDVARPVQSP